MVHAWQFGLVGILVVAMVTDIQTRKIYNWLTFPAMAMGLGLSLAFGGGLGLLSSFEGLFVGSLVFLIGFFVGAMGAGDVKLMAAVGTWMGFPFVIASVLYVTAIGGLVALGSAAYHGTLTRLLKNIYWSLVGLVVPGGNATVAVHESAAPPMPYGISIALGAALALFFPEPLALLNWVKGGP
jgi:prepilin peptidase CpaA